MHNPKKIAPGSMTRMVTLKMAPRSLYGIAGNELTQPDGASVGPHPTATTAHAVDLVADRQERRRVVVVSHSSEIQARLVGPCSSLLIGGKATEVGSIGDAEA